MDEYLRRGGFMRGNLPFLVNEFKERLNKVKESMRRENLDALLVNAPEDLYYLTGYHSMGYAFLGWQTLIISLKEDPIMVTRNLEQLSFRQQSWTDKLLGYKDHEDPIEYTVKVLLELGLENGRIGVPKKSWFMSTYHWEQISNSLPSVEWVDGSNIVAGIRIVKSEAEISYIRHSAQLLQKGLLAGVEEAKEGCSENDLAAAALHTMIKEGSEVPGTLPLIGAGQRSALGHSSWEGFKAGRGDVIFYEIGACVRRYHAAIMRTISIGEPSDFVKRLEEGSRSAINAAIDVIKPGVTSGDVDRACRQTVKKLGLGDYFHHRAGYSIGIGFTSWLDGPSLKEGDDTPLKAGMVFHVVPFLTDFKVSVAISETVLVTDQGAEKLTNVEQKIFVKD